MGNRTPFQIPRIFHSAGGRPIPDASGILPDLTIRGLPRTDAERALLAALGDDVTTFRSILSDYATEMAPQGPKSAGFEVTPEMRDQVFERIQQVGLELPRTTFDSASSYVDEQLGYEITRIAFGPEAEAKRRALSDRQMQEAVRLLRLGRTQDGVLSMAVQERSRLALPR
jgi:hypothetical protein